MTLPGIINIANGKKYPNKVFDDVGEGNDEGKGFEDDSFRDVQQTLAGERHGCFGDEKSNGHAR